MPAKSKSQQSAAGMALAAKRGEIPVGSLKGAAKDMYDSMSEKQLHDFAKTPSKDLPKKVKKEDIVGQIAAMLSEDPDVLDTTKTTLPCRSCSMWDEKNMEMFKDLPGGTIEGRCTKGYDFSNPAYLTYGVDSQEIGQSMCPGYEHDESYW
jgi:hypothetical protein